MSSLSACVLKIKVAILKFYKKIYKTNSDFINRIFINLFVWYKAKFIVKAVQGHLFFFIKRYNFFEG